MAKAGVSTVGANAAGTEPTAWLATTGGSNDKRGAGRSKKGG